MEEKKGPSGQIQSAETKVIPGRVIYILGGPLLESTVDNEIQRIGDLAKGAPITYIHSQEHIQQITHTVSTPANESPSGRGRVTEVTTPVNLAQFAFARKSAARGLQASYGEVRTYEITSGEWNDNFGLPVLWQDLKMLAKQEKWTKTGINVVVISSAIVPAYVKAAVQAVIEKKDWWSVRDSIKKQYEESKK